MLPGDSVRGHDITMRSVTARTTAELFQPYHNMKMWRGYVMVRSKEVGGAVETSRGGGGNEHKQLKPHWNGCGTLRGYDTALINVYGVPKVYRQEFITQWRAHGLDVLICPILGPALTLGYPGKLSSLWNRQRGAPLAHPVCGSSLAGRTMCFALMNEVEKCEPKWKTTMSERVIE
ncbi:unnamed protein product, partial [Ranitomeya imitator]